MVTQCCILAVLLAVTDAGGFGGGDGGGYGGGGGGYGFDQGQGFGLHKWQPYKFGYHVLDGHGHQHREEKSDGVGNVRGSYGYTDAYGHYRQVEYVADQYGFRAKVLTNEPGTASKNPANVKVLSTRGGEHGR
ncbi:cuticle protein 16.8-like [Ixodes scapularis]|uniref:cuticle protein 16.8-like n=1 Tax=Ixodes scapularis TaxID=6945 RepID=UPI001A9FFBE9|nr:cuticle protein 16.8-like [Ixodes scapularis]